MTDHDLNHNPPDEASPDGPAEAWPAFEALSFNVEEYRHYIADLGMTEVQEREYLTALWHILVSFVDLGFGLHPVQQAMGLKPLDVDSPDVVSFINSLNIDDKLSAAQPEGCAAGRKDS